MSRELRKATTTRHRALALVLIAAAALAGPGVAYAFAPADPHVASTYFGARYQDSHVGRFTRVDPVMNKKAALKNPQLWNRYAYSANNPLTYVDPDGRLTIIVHGTWAKNAEFAREGSAFNAAVSASFGEQAVPFNWSGGNSVQARARAARELKAFVDSHSFAEGEALNIVAHSHGGNVAKAYTQLHGARSIDTLVTLGTPQRPDYSIDRDAVGRYLNVYDPQDAVQANGGPWGRLAGRTDSVATNLAVPSGKAGVAAHSSLHEPEAWSVVQQVLPTVPSVGRRPGE